MKCYQLARQRPRFVSHEPELLFCIFEQGAKIFSLTNGNHTEVFFRTAKINQPDVAFQRLKYIHNNPSAEHWQLAKDTCEYKYSSARYYELNRKSFRS